MKLRQNKSKWEVVGDDGRFYSSHKTKRDAIKKLEWYDAISALANGWDRCTLKQRDILTEAGEIRTGAYSDT